MPRACLVVPSEWDVASNFKVFMVTIYLDFVAGIKLAVAKPFSDTLIVSPV